MHTCPDCGQACYCGNDIDDHENPNEAAFCTHCEDAGIFDEVPDDFDDLQTSGRAA